METTHFDPDKTDAIISYLAGQTQVTKTKLLKLLYLIDFKHFAKNNQSITGATYEHWPYGPVPIQVWARLENKRSNGYEVVKVSDEDSEEYTQYRIIANDGVDLTDSVSVVELETIKEVIKNFGHHSASQLVNLTHKQTPWRITNEQEQIPMFLSYYLEPPDLEGYAAKLRDDTILMEQLR